MLIMKRFFNISMLILLLAFSYPTSGRAALFPALSNQDTPPGELHQQAALTPTDQIIIRYKRSTEADMQPSFTGQLERLSQIAGVSLQYNRPMSGNAHVLRLPESLPLNKVQEIAARLSTLPDVEYAEADQIMQHTLDLNNPALEPDIRPLGLTPNDPLYVNQWHYSGTWGINAPTAWNITTGLSSIVVAVLDTGITTHLEFTGRVLPGYDFITQVSMANDGNGRDSNPSDPGDWVVANECGNNNLAKNSSWHGTHTAGTIAAKGNNGMGVAGVNWQSTILPIRVLGKCGGFTSDIVDGMRWAAGLAVNSVPANPTPAKVLNLSLGGSGACSATFQNAINTIITGGVVVVVSAGNSSIDASGQQPANCNGVITVAATNSIGARASYSNFGSTVEISAPGGDSSAHVLSTYNAGTQGPGSAAYGYMSGTSMAAPHVSGVVSLLLSLKPALTPAQILQILRKTAKPFAVGVTNSCTTALCGSGIVDAGAALAALKIQQFTSVGTYDGWVQESDENSSVGGGVNATDDNFRLGDSVLNRQFRGILHFDTSTLPDNAIILIVTVKIKKQSIAGINPFTTHGPINLNIRKGAYTDNNTLQNEDFQSPASLNTVGTITDAPVDDWYSSRLTSAAYTYLNLTGVTQFRLRFQLDDNNNSSADHIKFFSGDSAYKPTLIITYILP
jgi:serine protease